MDVFFSAIGDLEVGRDDLAADAKETGPEMLERIQ
jgi:hypothetical protein